ncbi:DeoR/GlpR family DNA-binding transcription regulator [Segatella maculosa]|uniref:DeoR/GlpR family DNA-binding transcription regulator n=1 Tax=Segatella maculosa TaxID=439703 RepID=UPI0003722BA9|nr:DeoR/GlpR family DNA-binding transcription regulator [Segatella maculosa]
MTKEERHTYILEQLMKQSSVQVSELAELLNVSSVTIRKDLTELEKNGRLYRSHGKAILINPFANNRSVNEKESLNAEEKQLIGMEAAQLVVPNDSILLASGTTIHALARNLRPADKLTVVSASLQATEFLAENENIDIIQIGGNVRHSSLSVVGQYSEMILRSCSFSKLFLGVDGIDLEFGISTTDMREAELNREMIHTAQKTIVLADSSKFGRRGFARICGMDDVDMIITDAHVSPTIAAAIEELGIELVIAGDTMASAML